MIKQEVEKSLSFSIRDGFFASIFATLIEGAFLTGFALALGANELHIGIVAAIPLLWNMFQYIGAYLVKKNGKRKPVSIKSATAARHLDIDGSVTCYHQVAPAEPNYHWISEYPRHWPSL
jgi:hypothetical protein